MPEPSGSPAQSIVLVHGGFVDGSGWEGVYHALRRQGLNVSIVQNPTTSLTDDVKATRRVIAAQSGPVVLVGHSYGGAVITEAGNDPKVVGLVYIAAFAPDKGESVATLIKDPPAGAPVPPILPPVDGFLLLDRGKFAASFAADVEPRAGGLHGRRPDPLGCRGAERDHYRASQEVQAKLVPGGHRRPHDSTASPATHVPARRSDRRRGGRKSCHLRFAARCGGGADSQGRQRHTGHGALRLTLRGTTATTPGSAP